MQDSPHSLKIKQEPFQLSPPSPLPPLHQGMCPFYHHFLSRFCGPKFISEHIIPRKENARLILHTYGVSKEEKAGCR